MTSGTALAVPQGRPCGPTSFAALANDSAVSWDNTTFAQTGPTGGLTLTWSHSVGSPGQSVGVVVNVATNDTTSVSTVTLTPTAGVGFPGAAISLLRLTTLTDPGAGNRSVESWVRSQSLVPGTTYDVTITFASSTRAVAGITSAFQVRQAAALQAFRSANGNGTSGGPANATQTTPASTNSLYFDITAGDGSVSLAPTVAYETEQFDCNTSGSSANCAAVPGDPTLGAATELDAAGSTWCRWQEGGGQVDNFWTLSGTTDWVTQLVEILPAVLSPVTLSSVKAGQTERGIALEWHAAAETNNLGYHVWRQDPGHAPVRLTKEVILGAGLVSKARLEAGYKYGWVDASGTTASRYWIEDVDLEGRVMRHNFPAVKGAAVAPLPNVRAVGIPAAPVNGQLSQAVRMNATSAALTNGYAAARRAAVQLGVTEAGWYKVTNADLVAAGLSSTANLTNLQLFVDGREVAIDVDVNGDVSFYGTGLEVSSTNERTYWLTVGNRAGKRISTLNAATKSTGLVQYEDVAELRERDTYFFSLANGERDNFFGSVIAGTVDKTVKLESLDGTKTAALEIEIQGVTAGSHEVAIELAGRTMGTVRFADKQLGVGKFRIPAGLLVEGDNSVRLVRTGATTDVSLLSAIKVRYARRAATAASELFFSAQSLSANKAQLPGSFRLFDVSNPLAAIEVGHDNGEFRLGGSSRTAKLYATTTEKSVHSIRGNVRSSWAGFSGAEGVIITNADVRTSADALAIYRRSQGYSVAVVDIQDIYDEFGYGAATPDALKRFVSVALARWSVKPRYLALFGDSTLDPRNYLGADAPNLVPSKLVDIQESGVESTSDEWFGDMDSDGVAELAIGRIPVRTESEGQAFLAKLLVREGIPASSALFVADRTAGVDFAGALDRLVSSLPNGLSVDRLYRGPMTDAQVKAGVEVGLSAGASFVTYYGHGGIDRWAGDMLSNDSFPSAAPNAQSGLFVMLNCLNGMFADPALSGLGEVAFNTPNGGAFAVFASSAITDAQDQPEIAAAFLAAVSSGQTLGDAALAAKRATKVLDQRKAFTLLGDPMSKLAVQ
ncbi:MAG: hypothetical protein HY791_31995 [Deltaproteobacteria bacterium]|nr:hypothetical protein [Deltaproteobacteria bacterium]